MSDIPEKELEELNSSMKLLLEWYNRHTNVTSNGPTDPPMRKISTQVVNCARCHGRHESLVFVPFINPIETTGDTHWAMCPTTSSPILLKVETPGTPTIVVFPKPPES